MGLAAFQNYSSNTLNPALIFLAFLKNLQLKYINNLKWVNIFSCSLMWIIGWESILIVSWQHQSFSSTCVVLTFFAYPHIAYQYQWSVETFVAVSGLDHF